MIRVLPKPNKFNLEDWYASEPAKRSFGRICQAVNEQGSEVGLLGTYEKPWLVLADADEYPKQPNDIEISIDEAKADWSAVTTAAMVYGTRFRIKGKRVERAVLFRHPAARHPAEKYMRSSSPDTDKLASQMEVLAKEIRKLGRQLGRIAIDSAGLRELIDRLDRSSEIFDRRFRQVWREAQGCAVQ